MEWEDEAFVLSVRTHGETGAVVELLTLERGRFAAHVAGAGGPGFGHDRGHFGGDFLGAQALRQVGLEHGHLGLLLGQLAGVHLVDEAMTADGPLVQEYREVRMPARRDVAAQMEAGMWRWRGRSGTRPFWKSCEASPMAPTTTRWMR